MCSVRRRSRSWNGKENGYIDRNGNAERNGYRILNGNEERERLDRNIRNGYSGTRSFTSKEIYIVLIQYIFIFILYYITT